MRASSSGPISETVARTGVGPAPRRHPKTPSRKLVRPGRASSISLARLRMKSLGSPASEMPERSPLMSAANTGNAGPGKTLPPSTCSRYGFFSGSGGSGDQTVPVLRARASARPAVSPLPTKNFLRRYRRFWSRSFCHRNRLFACMRSLSSPGIVTLNSSCKARLKPVNGFFTPTYPPKTGSWKTISEPSS